MDACLTPRSDEQPLVHDVLNLQLGRRPGQGRYRPPCSWISEEGKSILGFGSLRSIVQSPPTRPSVFLPCARLAQGSKDLSLLVSDERLAILNSLL